MLPYNYTKNVNIYILPFCQKKIIGWFLSQLLFVDNKPPYLILFPSYLLYFWLASKFLAIYLAPHTFCWSKLYMQ